MKYFIICSPYTFLVFGVYIIFLFYFIVFFCVFLQFKYCQPSIVCMFLFVNISPGSVIRAGNIKVSVTRLSVIKIIL